MFSFIIDRSSNNNLNLINVDITTTTLDKITDWNIDMIYNNDSVHKSHREFHRMLFSWWLKIQ